MVFKLCLKAFKYDKIIMILRHDTSSKSANEIWRWKYIGSCYFFARQLMVLQHPKPWIRRSTLSHTTAKYLYVPVIWQNKSAMSIAAVIRYSIIDKDVRISVVMHSKQAYAYYTLWSER